MINLYSFQKKNYVMKKSLLFILMLNISICANAQTETYFIDWSFGSNPSATGAANADRTIEVGDTVTWVWYATGTHNVVSNADATESFSSLLIGPGSEFSYTFTQVGANAYVCEPHSGNMFGTITVVADGSLTTQGFLLSENVSLYPNPAKGVFYLELENNFSNKLSISIYNTLGQEVKNLQTGFNPDEPINISELNSGMYFVKISEGDNSVTKRLIVK
jgi:plastocyanin